MPTLVDVVLADDSADVRSLVSLRLMTSGLFRVVGEGTTGIDAIDLTRTHRPRLLVLDVSMPTMGGLEALPLIREVSPETRVVMFSGFDAEELADEARRRGAVDFVPKSLPLSGLVGRLLDAASRPLPDLADARPPAPAPPASADGAVAAATAEVRAFGPPIGAAAAAGAPLDGAARPDPGQADASGAADAEGQAVLAEHLERFRAVFDEAAIGLATLTLSGRFVRINRALVTLLGGERERFLGRPYSDFAARGEAHALEAAVAELASGEREVAQSEHILRRGQTAVFSTLSAIRDSAGRPLYLLLQVQDISAWRRAESALRSAEERFRLMVESVADYAIFMLDAEGHVASWNAGAERIKGYRRDEIIGRHLRVFYTAEAQAAKHAEEELRSATRDGRYVEEGWRVRKDGSMFYANIVLTALFDEEHRLIGFVKVTRDVTERRRATEERDRAAAELAASNEALQQANREKSDILGTTAHEMRAPITVIRGYVDMLTDPESQLDTPTRERLLGALRGQSERLHLLLDDVLMAARLEAGAVTIVPRVVWLRPLINEVAARLRTSSSALIEVDCPPEIEVEGDLYRIEQMLVNYLGNALKYGAPPVEVSVRVEDRHVVVRVRDSGDGVAADVAPRLFEKFSRSAETSEEGAGLGLFIVRGLARTLGGDAWHEPGEPGATFAFRLPLPNRETVEPTGPR